MNCTTTINEAILIETEINTGLEIIMEDHHPLSSLQDAVGRKMGDFVLQATCRFARYEPTLLKLQAAFPSAISSFYLLKFQGL